MRLFVALLATAVASAGPALAQNERAAAADILGRWSFAADAYPECSFHGEAVITAGPSEELYLCELTATDECPGSWSYTAEQTCIATREGDQLRIKSRITRVEPPTDFYLPDDFLLRIVSGSLMEGELHSSGVSPARFVRTEEPVS